MKKPIFFLTILFLVPPTLWSAVSGVSYLKIDPSAKSQALGRIQPVASLGAQSIGANPANLMSMSQKYEGFTTFSNLMEDAQYAHVAFSIGRSHSKGKMNHAFGVAVTHLTMGQSEVRDEQGKKTGASVESSANVIALGIGRMSSKNVAYGVTVKAIKSEIAGYTSNTGVAVDIGIGYSIQRFAKPVQVGMSVNNVGEGVKHLDQKDALPSTINAGLSFDVGPVTAVVGLRHQSTEKMTTGALGLQYNLGHLALRAGYRSDIDSSRNLAASSQKGASALLEGLSTGFGLKVGPATLDYALGQQAVEYGLSHKVSLTWGWGNK